MSKKIIEEIIPIGMGFVEHAYPDSYLKPLCKKIGIKNQKDQKAFCDRIKYAGQTYLDLKLFSNNPIRSSYKKLLNEYKAALEQTLEGYRAVQASNVASGKLGKAIRERYDAAKDAAMKEMFHPYCNDTSMATTLFEKFLEELIVAAGEAKKQDVGDEDKNIKTNIFTDWIVSIAKAWPQDASIKLALGKYDKGGTLYTSRCISILHEIVCKIEANVTEKNIETALRKIKRKKLLDQPVARFRLE